MADRTVKVGLKADVASYISAIRAAERATSTFADRAVADAHRAQAALAGGGPAGAPGGGGPGPAGPAPHAPSTSSTDSAAAARARAEEQRLAKQAEAMDTVGVAAVGMGAAIESGLLMSAKAAIDWESAWAGVTKTVDGSAKEMADLEGQLRGMARTLPISHKEIAGVAEAAGQLGVKRQDIASFTKTMIDLGVSTNLSAEDASTAIAQMANVMGTAPKDVSRLGAALVALGNAGASTESDIMSMASRLSGAGKLVGASESGVLAMANAMSSVGIESELGGGAMSRTLQKIYTSVKSGGPMLENFARIAGMSAQDFAKAFQADPMTAVAEFTSGLGRIKDQGGNVIAALDGVKIKGTQDLQVLLRLAGAGNLLADSLELGADAWQKNTALTDEAGKRYATVAAKLSVAKNNIVDLAIQIGDVLLPIIAKMADATGDVIRFIESMPGPVRDITVALLALGGGLTLLGGALLLTVPRIVAVRTALQTLAASAMWTQITTNFALMRGGMVALMSTAAGPWVLAFAAAAAAIGALLLMNRKSKPPIDDLTDAIKANGKALNDANREVVVRRLREQGLIDLADEHKLALADVTAAAMGSAEAQDRLTTSIAAARGPYEEQIRKMRETRDVSASTATAIERIQASAGVADAQSKLAQLDKLSAAVATNADSWARAGAMADQDKRAMAAAEDQATRTASAMEDQFNRAMGRAATSARLAAGGTAVMKQEAAALAVSAKDAEKKLKDLSAALDALFEQAYGAPRALDAFHKALNDLGDQVKENGHRLRGFSNAAIANREAIRDAAEKVGEYAQELLEAGEPVDSVAAKVRSMRKDLLDKADALGMDRAEVRKLIEVLDDLPETVKVQLGVETAAAQSNIERTQAMINELHGRTIPINVAVSGSSLDRYTAGITRASGGIVHGPGGPRGDAIPAWLSDGEYVVNASATAKNRPLLDHVNAGGYAAGGPAGQPWPASFYFSVTTAKAAEKALTDLGKRLDKVNDTLRADKLGQARKDAREMASAIKAAFVQGADITSLPNAGGTTGQLLGDLQGKLDRAHAFTGAVDQLRKAGLNKAALDQIVGGGAEGGGLAAATQLLNDMGAIKRVNDLMARISAEGAKLGAREAKAKYADTIRKAEIERKNDLAERRRLLARKAELTRLQRELEKTGQAEKDTREKATAKARAKRVTGTGNTLSAVSSGGSLAPLHVKVTFDTTGTDKHLKAWIRQMVRVDGGGSVQKAFGT